MKSKLLLIVFILASMGVSYSQFSFSSTADYYPGGYYELHKIVTSDFAAGSPFKYGDAGVGLSQGYKIGGFSFAATQYAYIGYSAKDINFSLNHIEFSVSVWFNLSKSVSIGVERMNSKPIINNLSQSEFSTKSASYNKLSIKYSYGVNK